MFNYYRSPMDPMYILFFIGLAVICWGIAEWWNHLRDRHPKFDTLLIRIDRWVESLDLSPISICRKISRWASNSKYSPIDIFGFGPFMKAVEDPELNTPASDWEIRHQILRG